VETTRTSWTIEAEAAIRALRNADVQAVSIEAVGDDVSEVHVLSTSHRPAKQIVRDIQSILRTRFNRSIDHRVVSVVFTDVPSPSPVAEARVATGPRPVETPSAAPGALPFESTPPAEVTRIRFSSVNLYVSGPRAQAQVELRWKGVPRMGSAAGWSTREGANRLIAAATVAAIHEYLSEEVALGVEDLSVVRVGRQEVVVAALALISHRQQKTLVGCCTVEQDVQQSVVLATLAALNRVLGGLKTREPIEYVLRPTST
jgi:hypothetical protein